MPENRAFHEASPSLFRFDPAQDDVQPVPCQLDGGVQPHAR